jgi:hypothetical protein
MPLGPAPVLRARRQAAHRRRVPGPATPASGRGHTARRIASRSVAPGGSPSARLRRPAAVAAAAAIAVLG